MPSSELKQTLTTIAERLRSDIASLRTGRATPALVEDLLIDYYGTKTPLKAVASIVNAQPRELIIQPWDKQALPAIEKAIQSSQLGLNPIAEKDVIRLGIPPLTEERRKELLKLLGRHGEEARIHIRREREDALREVTRAQRAGEISEDEQFRKKHEIQNAVENINEQIEQIVQKKEREITTI